MKEFAAALPPEWKLKGFRKKHVLKRSQAGRLSAEALTRGKSGFNAPMSHWLTGGLAGLAYEATTSDAMNEWFRRDDVEESWRQHRTGARDNSYRLSGLMCLGLWRHSSAG